ncbi:hypothetical protein E4O92_21125 [Massilia horti]|uniref:Uncharacterized protein n=1 Tax=Massilia horti TaxID=2562153 RepID=A0A4Y9SP67_9BURK|nr:hypothetical protein E4O92_21125 [Massilia horti]
MVISLAHAADPSSDPYGLWKPLQGAIYKIHSGIVADRTPPTGTDRKLTVLVDGKTAKDIFDSIGPDLPETCSGETGDRMRDKQGIHCSYTAEHKGTKDGPYRCWIGLDLRTGESVGTVSC